MRVIVHDVDAADRNEIETLGEINYLPDIGDFISLGEHFYEVRRRLFLSNVEVWIDAKRTDIAGKLSFSPNLFRSS